MANKLKPQFGNLDQIRLLQLEKIEKEYGFVINKVCFECGMDIEECPHCKGHKFNLFDYFEPNVESGFGICTECQRKVAGWKLKNEYKELKKKLKI